MRERGLGLLLLALGELAGVENEPIKCIIGALLPAPGDFVDAS